MKTGGLVPDDLIMRLISNELFQRGWLKGQGPPRVMTLVSNSLSEPNIEYREPSGVDTFMGTPSLFDAPDVEMPKASECPSASFILDGFPRTAPQARILDRIIPINLVVSIKTPLEVIMERIAGRWVHEPSGRVYNTTFNAPRAPGLDDVTGEPLTKRADDTEDVYRARFRKFQETSEPLLEHYAKKGVLVEVDGMSSDDISPKLYDRFEKLFVH
jgi:adenylate kinase